MKDTLLKLNIKCGYCNNPVKVKADPAKYSFYCDCDGFANGGKIKKQATKTFKDVLDDHYGGIL